MIIIAKELEYGKKMKRIEMIEIIAIEMMARLPEWEKQERLNFAKELLQVIEINEMVHPKRIWAWDCDNDWDFEDED